MYTRYFGLQKRPFILSADPEFFFLSRAHDLALTHLEYGLMHNVGIVALTGEVGAGKTTLMKYLFSRIEPSLDIAMVLSTHLGPRDLLDVLVREFEVTPASTERNDLFYALAQFFMNQYGAGRRCIIMVDEAQNLPHDTFEELRMLSNLEIESDFLLQIILVGQPQLRDRLSHPSLKQLAQRISVTYHLSSLSQEEVHAYVEHRLKVAGYSGPEPLFAPEALDRLARVSGGIPRVINTICDAALTYAFAEGLRQVSRDMVEKVFSEQCFLASAAPEDAIPPSAETPVDGDGEAIPVPSSPRVEGTGETASPEQPQTGLKAFSHRLQSRVESLELRLRTLETDRIDRLSEVLREMLNRERERNRELERENARLHEEIRETRSRLKESREDPVDELELPARQQAGGSALNTKIRGIWRVWSGSKD